MKTVFAEGSVASATSDFVTWGQANPAVLFVIGAAIIAMLATYFAK